MLTKINYKFYILSILLLLTSLQASKDTNQKFDLDCDGQVKFGFSYADNTYWTDSYESNIWNYEFNLIGKADIAFEVKHKDIKAKVEIEVDRNDPKVDIENLWLRFKWSQHQLKVGYQKKDFGLEESFSFSEKDWNTTSIVNNYLSNFGLYKYDFGINHAYKSNKINSNLFLSIRESKTTFFGGSLNYFFNDETSIGIGNLYSLTLNQSYEKLLYHDFLNLNFSSNFHWQQYIDAYLGLINNKGLGNFQNAPTLPKQKYSFLGITQRNKYDIKLDYKFLKQTNLLLSESLLIQDLKEAKEFILEFTTGFNLKFTPQKKFAWSTEAGVAFENIQNSIEPGIYYRGFIFNSIFKFYW